MTDIDLDQITITRTIEDGEPMVKLNLSDDLDWLTALGMLSAAQLTLVDGIPEDGQ